MSFIDWELKKSGRIRYILIILLLFFIITGLVFRGMFDAVQDARGMPIDSMTLPNLFYFNFYSISSRVPWYPSMMMDNIVLIFAVPIVLGAGFTGKFIQERKNGTLGILRPLQSGRDYYVTYALKMGLLVFIIIFLCATLQVVGGYFLNRLLPSVERTRQMTPSMALGIFLTNLRVSAIYSIPVIIALLASALWPKMGRLVHLIPLALIIISDLNMIDSPLRVSAMYTSIPPHGILLKWSLISLIIIIGLIAMTLRYAKRRDEL